MPHTEWREEDVRLSISFFPCVGAVIGAIICILHMASIRTGIHPAAEASLMIAVPLIVTGGFHADGFMDMSDALNSYGDRERKLEILKDPHIGAFAVIRLAAAGLIFFAALTEIIERDGAAGSSAVTALGAGFVLSRALSALSVLRFRSARNEGMLYYEASAAAGAYKANLVITLIWIAASIFVMTAAGGRYGAFGIAGGAAGFAWYRYISYKELGGITGDTAGYFVVICEVLIASGISAGLMIC